MKTIFIYSLRSFPPVDDHQMIFEVGEDFGRISFKKNRSFVKLTAAKEHQMVEDLFIN